MNLAERLKGVAIAMAILIICFPLAIIITIFTSSFWLWVELNLQIEAYGHSGPAEWCYLVSYGFIVAIFTYVWSRIRNKST
jgi:preprotein translocase subunit SecY